MTWYGMKSMVWTALWYGNTLWYGMVWCGPCGVVWWCGVQWCGVVQGGVAWCGVVWTLCLWLPVTVHVVTD